MTTGNGKFNPEETIAARIPIGEMIVDSYQGHINQSLVERIAKNWDESAAGAIILNLRDDGHYAVLDGQHRVKAAAQSGVTELSALVFIGKSKQEEARLFVMLNTKHNVSAIDRFRANLEAGGVVEKNIRHALREVGLDVGLAGPGDDRVQCVSALLDVYNTHGLAQFKLIVGILQSAYAGFPDRGRGWRTEAFRGLAAFLVRYPHVNTKEIIDVLRKKGPTVVAALAASMKIREDSTTAWGKTLWELYNESYREGSKSRLPEWKRNAYSPEAKTKMSTIATASPLIQQQRHKKLGRISTKNYARPQ